MRMVRQPTIKSLLLLMVVVTVLAACTGPLRGDLSDPGDCIGLTSLLVYAIAPAVVPLFIQRLTVVVGTLVALCGLAMAGVFIALYAIRLQSDTLHNVAMIFAGLAVPFEQIAHQFLFKDTGQWLLALASYIAVYVSLGPLFALTCRLRQLQGN